MHNVIFCPKPAITAVWHPATVAQLVLDADTIAQADGTIVAIWNSTGSVTSYQAQQATAGIQPKLVKNVLGGRAVVRFDGDDYLIVSGLDTGVDGFSMIALVRVAVPGNYPMIMSYDPNGGWEIRASGATGTWQYVGSGGSGFVINVDINIVNVWRMLEGIYRRAGNMGYAFTDASLNATSPSTLGPRTNMALWLGRRSDNYPMTGDIACAIVVKGDLADADRQKIEGWMAWRWSITASLPADHPYKTSPPLAPTTWDYSLYEPSSVPATLNSGGTPGITLGVVFYATQPGNITAFRFYKPAGDTSGSHVGTLWKTDGTKLVEVTFSGETASGWQQQILPTPFPIVPRTLYMSSIYTPARWFGYTSGYAPNRTMLRLPQDAGISSDGSSPVYPTVTTTASLFADLVFTSPAQTPTYTLCEPTESPTSEAAGPYVVGWDFQAYASGHVTGIRFWKNSKDPIMVHTGKIWANDQSTILAQADSSGETASGWQEFKLPTPLSIVPNTLHTVSMFFPDTSWVNYGAVKTITSGVLQAPTGVGRYSAGSADIFPAGTYGANYFVDVMFEPLPVNSPLGDYSLYTPTDVPPTVGVGAGSAYVIGTDFKATIPGKITAIRFWKNSSDTTSSRPVAIWTADGSTNLLQVTSSGETASGWQQVNLPSPLTLTPNTHYVVSVLYPAGWVMSGPMVAVTTGVLQSDTACFVASSTMIFPSTSTTVNRYFTDVVFQG